MMIRVADLMSLMDALKFHDFQRPECVQEVDTVEAEPSVVEAQENMVRNIADSQLFVKLLMRLCRTWTLFGEA
jgi:hypothetical protein